MLAATLLALGAAVLHAGWNLKIKQSGDRWLALWGLFVAGGLIGLPYAVIATLQGDLGLALGLARRKKTHKHETVARQSRHRERRQDSRGTGRSRHHQPCLDHRPPKLITRIRDQRGPGLGHASDRLALSDRIHKPRLCPRAGMVMIGHNRPASEGNAVNFHELSGGPRILGGNHVGRGKDVEATQRHIARGADRG